MHVSALRVESSGWSRSLASLVVLCPFPQNPAPALNCTVPIYARVANTILCWILNHLQRLVSNFWKPAKWRAVCRVPGHTVPNGYAVMNHVRHLIVLQWLFSCHVSGLRIYKNGHIKLTQWLCSRPFHPGLRSSEPQTKIQAQYMMQGVQLMRQG